MELETFFSVSEQTRLLLLAILLGIPLGMGYDVLRTIRVLIPHGKFAAAWEDIVFLLGWAGLLLCFSVGFARGEFRGYYAMGSALGFLLYRCTLGSVTVPLLRRILEGVFYALHRIFLPLYHGSVRICSLILRKFGHFAKLFQKACFFSDLPLHNGQKMLYNESKRKRRKAVQIWQRKKKQSPDVPAGFSG